MKMSIENYQKNRFVYIDALRGVAIIMVIMVHTAQSISGISHFPWQLAEFGQMGVQLFFVLSAFTLCNSYEQKKCNPNVLSIFYLRRFFRIAPMYYFGILLYFLFSFWHFTAATFQGKYSILDVAFNVFFLHGFVESANNVVVPGGWSIGTEVAFYAIFPLLFNFFYGFKTPILGMLLISLLTYFTIKLVSITTGLSLQNHNFLYLNVVTQLPVFLVGIIYYFADKRKYLNSISTIFILLHFLITVSIAFISFTKHFHYSLTPFLSALAFVSLIELYTRIPQLSPKILVSIGQKTYSMYILHFIFAWIISYHIFIVLKEYLKSDFIFIICLLLSISLTYIFASITEKIIEKPGIRLGKYYEKYFY